MIFGELKIKEEVELIINKDKLIIKGSDPDWARDKKDTSLRDYFSERNESKYFNYYYRANDNQIACLPYRHTSYIYCLTISPNSSFLLFNL
jgi:hypothetical protein